MGLRQYGPPASPRMTPEDRKVPRIPEKEISAKGLDFLPAPLAEMLKNAETWMWPQMFADWHLRVGLKTKVIGGTGELTEDEVWEERKYLPEKVDNSLYREDRRCYGSRIKAWRNEYWTWIAEVQNKLKLPLLSTVDRLPPGPGAGSSSIIGYD